ncbi:MAG: RNA polymerase sigma factor (sigma-70 family) [Cyclobacteriaceae bacterium]
MKGESHHIHKHLVEQCQTNDASAQEELYKLYAGAMYNICRRMMNGEDEAKDLLQESFVDAFRKLPSLRETSTFPLWLKRIVTNNCINAIRKKKLDTVTMGDEWDAVDDVAPDLDYTNYQAGQVMIAVDKLPNGCKTVLNLYLFEGYDHKEIGGILGITESASKAQYSKAKARIRNYLELNHQQHVR